MKKTLLLIGTWCVLGGAGCGASGSSGAEGVPAAIKPDTPTIKPDSPAIKPDSPAVEPDSPAVEPDTTVFTTQSCAQLMPSSVIAQGHDGNVPQNTLDNRLDTRWSHFGKGAWIDYDLGAARPVSGAAIAWHQGNRRYNTFAISVSPDGSTYTQVYSGRSSGTTTAAETYTFPQTTTRRVRITVNGNSLNDWASIAEARPCSTSTQPPTDSVVWRGDFETGDRSQWSKAQIVGPDRVQVVPSPVRQGRYALRVEVRQGDDPINSSGNRNELVKFDGSSEGREFYYSWSTLWPSDYPLTPTWQVFMQWHHPGSSGAPPVRFVLGCSTADCGRPLPDTLFFIVNGKTQWTMSPVTRGQWHDFILHVKWSANPSVGFVELWYDGNLVVPKRYVRTLYNASDTNYLKMGLYRDESTRPTAVLFHDGLIQAKTLEAVMQRAVSREAQASSTGAP